MFLFSLIILGDHVDIVTIPVIHFHLYPPWKWQPTPVFLPGEFHGQRSLVGYSPWDRKDLDTTERLHFRLCIFEVLSINSGVSFLAAP